MTSRAVVIGLFLFGINYDAQAETEWSGYVAGEWRYFSQSPLSVDQYEHSNFSLVVQPEYHRKWDDGYQTITFVPFIRLDQQDSERSHFDIRELTWLKATQNWELRLGIRKLFWGVTESQHLVDIINQTDLVENPDGEDKLGQPMLNLALIRDWGTVDLLVLPGFRERTFPGKTGRLLSGGLPIVTEQTRYESSAEEEHVDWAIRWSHYFGAWDIGLSHFVGTSREPQLLPHFDTNGQPFLIPYYQQIEQTGLDVQMTQEDLLWKLEMISRDEQSGRFTALTGGFEYTLVGVFESNADVGIITEYLFDDRGDNTAGPFENDLMMGMRFTLNDVQSTEFLTGIILDLDNQSRFYNIEASRRLGESWKLSLEARFYTNIPATDRVYGLRNEDYMQLELAWYF